MDLKKRMFPYVLGIVVLLITCICTAFSLLLIQSHRKETLRFFQEQVRVLARMDPATSLPQQRLLLKALEGWNRAYPEVAYAAWEKNGRFHPPLHRPGLSARLAGRPRPPLSHPSVWEFQDPNGSAFYDVAVRMEPAGAVLHLGLSRDAVDRQVRPALFLLLFAAAVAVLLAMVLSRLAGRWITAEAEQLAHALETEREGYRALVEDMPVLICRFHPDGTLTYVNDATCRYFGKSRQELLGSDFFQFIPEKDREKIRERYRSLNPDHPVASYEHQVVGPDGTLRWQHRTDRALFDAQGRVKELQSIGEDITNQKRAQQTLAVEREQLLSIFDSIEHIIYVSDPFTYEVLYCNDVLRRALGKDPVGGICYREFQGLDEPCPFCTNSIILRQKGKSHVWEYHNPLIGRDYLINDVLIPWPDGRDVRFEMAVDISKRKHAEKKIQEANAEKELILQSLNEMVTYINRDYVIQWANLAAARSVGMQPEAMAGRRCHELWHQSPVPCEGCPVETCFETGRNHEVELTTRDGRIWQVGANAVLNDAGEVIGAVEVVSDITAARRAEEEQKKLEAQVQQVQKLESLGVLAGGIAHDFNNLLMTILGNAELALADLPTASSPRYRILEIEKASRRAAELCRQMLAYSGKGKFVVELLNLNRIVEEMGHLLNVSISKKIVLKYDLAENLSPIEGDATQLRQVIMNLIMNASEAIGDQRGVISISTGITECDRAYLSETWLDEGLPEGWYVYLEVTDTGCGMEKETLARIFDPFFTTKFTGRGLGMAAVLGIVRGHHGAIKIYTEKGKGSSFKVLFPAAQGIAHPEHADEHPDSTPKIGEGTVLLVDDEATVRAVAKQMLERLGFRVLIAESGGKALELFRNHAETIVCVLLDLTMPEMGGEETFREMRKIKKDVRVILCSGYNQQDVTQRFVGKGLAGFLQKPYRMATLAEILKKVLGPSPETESNGPP